MDPTDVLETLRESEINFVISHFYDAGFTFKLGDATNGFLDDGLFDTFEDGCRWLWQTAEKHFPDASAFE